MLKMRLQHYKLVELAKDHPEICQQLLDASRKTAKPLDITIGELVENSGYHWFECYINDVNELPPEVIKRAEFEALPVLKIFNEGLEPLSGKKLGDALHLVQLHLPGNELLKIGNVKVAEDLCTEELQKELSDGWRIVAVIPRTGQRRPDYVLGKL